MILAPPQGGKGHEFPNFCFPSPIDAIYMPKEKMKLLKMFKNLKLMNDI